MSPPLLWLLAVRRKKLLHLHLHLWLHRLQHQLLLLKPLLAPLLLLLALPCKLLPLPAPLLTHPKMLLALLKMLPVLLPTLPRRLLKPLLQRSNFLNRQKKPPLGGFFHVSGLFFQEGDVGASLNRQPVCAIARRGDNNVLRAARECLG